MASICQEVVQDGKMAKRAQKAGKRATAPKRAGPVREPKSGKSKPERPKSELRAAWVRSLREAS